MSIVKVTAKTGFTNRHIGRAGGLAGLPVGASAVDLQLTDDERDELRKIFAKPIYCVDLTRLSTASGNSIICSISRSGLSSTSGTSV